jgi:hypothetical protein
MGSWGPTVKRRTFHDGVYNFDTRVSGVSPWIPRNFYSGQLTEEIISQCHTGTWPPPLSSDTDVGGPMTLHRTWDRHTKTGSVDWSFTRGITGIASVVGYTFNVAPASSSSGSILNAFGTSAVAAVLPTNPNSSLATALAELKKDGIPRLPGSSVRDQVDAARRAGDEYLNIEFGWLPLVRDILSFAHSVKNARVLVDQYVRDSDRQVRRRFEPAAITSTSSYTGNGLCYGQSVNAPGTSVSRSEYTRLWFSGAFKYHVPVGSDVYSRLRRYEALANHLFGTRITPELLWNIAPWSWAVDWFTNTGDVVHNISQLGSDGLVMHYGYAMRHMRVTEEVRGRAIPNNGLGSPSGVPLARSIGSEWKQRIRANPYGFGIDDVDLTARQLAILTALGLTRGSRTQ